MGKLTDALEADARALAHTKLQLRSSAGRNIGLPPPEQIPDIFVCLMMALAELGGASKQEPP
jgi:hypothetical protein